MLRSGQTEHPASKSARSHSLSSGGSSGGEGQNVGYLFSWYPSPSLSFVLHHTDALTGMKLALRFLRFLRKLICPFRHRWDQSTRLLWYIFSFVRSRIFPKNPKKRDKLRRDVEYRPTKPPTTVTCASRFPPPLAPIAGGDTPITPPIPTSIQVRQPRTSNHEDTVCETHENHSHEHLGVNPVGSRLILGSPDPAGDRSEPEPTHVIAPPHREDCASPATHSPAESRTSGSIHRDRPGTAVDFGPVSLAPSKDRLRPVVGIDRLAIQKRVVIEAKFYSHVCPPVTTEFVRDSAPDDWVPLMHPEGGLYWAHKTDPIYTDTNMCDPDLLQEIEQSIEDIKKLRQNSPPLPEDWELALELGVDDETGEPICSYYFVCHSSRCLFWLHEFNAEDVMDRLLGVTEKSHIHLVLQAQYWSHWEVFPHDRDIPEELLRELSGILLHAGIDCMTSSNSNTIYSEPELNKLLDYVKHIKRAGGKHGFSACVVGRLMTFFVHSRYVNFYGQKGARLFNNQTIYGYRPKRTYLIRTLSIFLFYAPELHLKGLETVYTDFVLCYHRWAGFIKRLQTDWTELVLFGTVLLNANVAFLAIPSVDPGNHVRTPAQLASYLSIITSVGSVVTGLLLLRKHRAELLDTAERVDRYLRRHHHNAFGFETLAFLFSLPYSLLLWALISFLTAFGLEVLLYSDGLWARLPVGTILAMIVLLISWCVWTISEARGDFNPSVRVRILKDSLVDFTRGLWGRVPEPVSGVGGPEGGDGQGEIRIRSRSGALKVVFNWLRRPRNPADSTSPTLPTGSNRSGPPDVTAAEMGDTSNNAPESAV